MSTTAPANAPASAAAAPAAPAAAPAAATQGASAAPPAPGVPAGAPPAAAAAAGGSAALATTAATTGFNGPYPLHGTFTFNKSTRVATWSGDWALNLTDLHSGVAAKIAPFEFTGRDMPKTAAAGASAAGAGGVDGASSSSSSSSSSLGSPFPTGLWSGYVKINTPGKKKLLKIVDDIKEITFTRVAGQDHHYYVSMSGDNKIGAFTISGTLQYDPETSASAPLNMLKAYTKIWTKQSRRPARKRIASSSLTEAEKEEFKRRRVSKTIKNLTGPGSGTDIGRSGATAGTTRRATARQRVVPSRLRSDPKEQLPDSMPQWAAKCFSVLEDIRAHHEQVHKRSGLHGIFDRPQKLFGWAGAETYLPKLTASHTFPCDLGTIRQRLLDSGTSGAFYTSHHSFAADVRRVFHNAMVFNQNPKAPIPKMASTLAKKFETSYDRIVKKEIRDESARQQQREIKLKEQAENRKRKAETKARKTAEKTAKRVEKAEAKLVKSQKMKERAALKRVIAAQKREQKKKLKKQKKARAPRAPRVRAPRPPRVRAPRAPTASRAINRAAERENERLRQELESMRRTMTNINSTMQHLIGGGLPGGGLMNAMPMGGGPVGHGQGPGPADRRGKPDKTTKQQRPVTAAQKEKCLAGLPAVAHRFVDEFRKLCQELHLLDSSGTVQLNLHDMPDKKARELVTFVKRKMMIIKREKEKNRVKEGAAAHDSIRAAAMSEANANKRENDRIDSELERMNASAGGPASNRGNDIGGAGLFDSEDEDGGDAAGGVAGLDDGGYDPFAALGQDAGVGSHADEDWAKSVSELDKHAGAQGGAAASGRSAWGDAKELKAADDRRRQGAMSVESSLVENSRQAYEKDAREVRESALKMEDEQRKNAELQREKQAANDREREEHRRQQQVEREQLAMQDSFENPGGDEDDYDPYAFGFGDD